jgi:hypothetical protein
MANANNVQYNVPEDTFQYAVLLHGDTLLGNDRKKSYYRTAIAKQWL